MSAESEVSRQVIFYGDVKWVIDAYDNSNGDWISISND
jgi:hypothetical protein